MSAIIRLQLPDDIARQLGAKWDDLSRAALESLAADAYRFDLISTEQVRRLLGFATRFEVEEFLAYHKVYDQTLEEFERDSETLRGLQKTATENDE